MTGDFHDTVSPSWTCALRLPRDPRAPGVARATLRAVLGPHDLAELTPTAELLTSELLTNAVRAETAYGDGRDVAVRFELSGAELRVEVSDSAGGKPELRCAEDGDECGRGLVLVDALADDWGVAPRHGAGKVVWALLALSPVGRGGGR
ncbi:ATP-binding protein [Streptomyces sp. NPDC002643]